MSTAVPVLLVVLCALVAIYVVRRSTRNQTPKARAEAERNQAEERESPTVHRVLESVRAILKRKGVQATISSYGATHIDPKYLVVLLMLETDRERNAITADRDFRERFRQALVDADYPRMARDQVQFVAESQETVDRDFGGNWFHALK